MNLTKKVKRFGKTVFFELKAANRMNPNIMIFVMYGMLFDLGLNIYRPFAAKYLIRIGGDAFHITLLNALPWLAASLVLIPGSFLLSRAKNSKRATCMLIFLSRLLLFLAVFIPALPPLYMPFAFIAVITLLHIPEALSQTSLQSVVGTVLTGNQRPVAIGIRNKFGHLCVLIASITTGLIISYVPSTEEQTLLLYQIFFVIAFLVGLLEVYTFSRFKLPEKAENSEVSKRKFSDILKTVKDKRFMRFTITIMLFHVPWFGLSPLFAILQIERLGANELWIALSAAATGVSAILSASFWTKFINKRGNHKALAVATFLMGVSVLTFMTAQSAEMLAAISLFAGFCMMGTTTTIFNGLLSATPDEDRMTYIGVYNSLINVAQFTGPFVSLLLFNMVGLMWALAIIAVLRMAAGGLIYFINSGKKERI
ncbi:MAG: MFS transporter [Defluviitaleaceae bacterium]|nr:MFS transporter [Defluviitaleaceae bacterium]